MKDYQYTVVAEVESARGLKDKAEADFPALIDLGPTALMYFYNFMAYEENLPRMPDELRERLSQSDLGLASTPKVQLVSDLFAWIAEEERRRQHPD